jgi:hypothetical protein
MSVPSMPSAKRPSMMFKDYFKSIEEENRTLGARAEAADDDDDGVFF